MTASLTVMPDLRDVAAPGQVEQLLLDRRLARAERVDLPLDEHAAAHAHRQQPRLHLFREHPEHLARHAGHRDDGGPADRRPDAGRGAARR